MCLISPEQEWGRQGHVQPLGLSEAHDVPAPDHHDHHNNHHDHEVDNIGDQNHRPIVIVMITIVITTLIVITKPLAKVASSAGARPWFSSRL